MNNIPAKVMVPVKIGMTGKFLLDVKHGDGSISHFEAPNKVVNQGLDALGGLKPSAFGSATLNAFLRGGIAVGTGNAVPNAADTALAVPLAFSTNTTGFDLVTVNSTTAPYSQTYSTVCTFTTGSVIGNIAEIGMLLGRSDGSYAASGSLFSRALIQVGGSPGTITLTATDQLIVTYQLQWVYSADGSGTINVTTDGTPVSVNWTCRPYNMGQGSGSSLAQNYFSILGPWQQGGIQNAEWWTNTAYVGVTTSGAPTGGNNDTAPMSAYTGGTYTRSMSYNWNTGHTITNRVMAALPVQCFQFQVLFNTPISLTTTQTMVISFSLTWADLS